jgi:hypothetical protein
VKLEYGNMHEQENENGYSKEPYGEDFVTGRPMLLEKSMIGLNV